MRQSISEVQNNSLHVFLKQTAYCEDSINSIRKVLCSEEYPETVPYSKFVSQTLRLDFSATAQLFLSLTFAYTFLVRGYCVRLFGDNTERHVSSCGESKIPTLKRNRTN